MTPSVFLALRPGAVAAPTVACLSPGASPLLWVPLALPTPMLVFSHLCKFNPLSLASLSCQGHGKSSETVQEREAEFMILPEATCFAQDPAMSVGTVARMRLTSEHASCWHWISGSKSALLLDKPYTFWLLNSFLCFYFQAFLFQPSPCPTRPRYTWDDLSFSAFLIEVGRRMSLSLD